MNLNVSVGPTKSFSEQFYLQVSDRPKGKFAQIILEGLQKKTKGVISLGVPETILTPRLYVRGLSNYTRLYNRRSEVPPDLTETDIFYLAAVAYGYNDVTPLLNLDRALNQQGDKYYWLYLAHNEDLFYSTVEIELFRRRIIKDIGMFSLTVSPPKFKPLRREGDSANEITREVLFENKQTRLSSLRILLPPRFGEAEPELQLNRSMPDSIERMLRMYRVSDLKEILTGIINAGGVIIGDFVSSLIVPSYTAFELAVPFDNNDTPIKTRESNFDDGLLPFLDSGLGHIGELEIAIKTFYARHLQNSDDLYDETRSFLREMKKKYRDFDLEEHLESNKHFLFADKNNGKLYRLFFNHAREVTIYVTGSKYQESVEGIKTVLVKKLSRNVIVRHTEDSIIFSNPLNENGLKFRLIKCAYSYSGDVLASAALNSSRVRLTFRDKKFDIIAPSSYINAVEYGAQVVVPRWQDTAFNWKILERFPFGFEPVFPGNIQVRFDMFYHDKLYHDNRNGYSKLVTLTRDEVNADYERSMALEWEDNGSLMEPLFREYSTDYSILARQYLGVSEDELKDNLRRDGDQLSYDTERQLIAYLYRNPSLANIPRLDWMTYRELAIEEGKESVRKEDIFFLAHVLGKFIEIGLPDLIEESVIKYQRGKEYRDVVSDIVKENIKIHRVLYDKIWEILRYRSWTKISSRAPLVGNAQSNYLGDPDVEEEEKAPLEKEKGPISPRRTATRAFLSEITSGEGHVPKVLTDMILNVSTSELQDIYDSLLDVRKEILREVGDHLLRS